MRRSLSTGVAVTALLAGLGVALAQQPPAGNSMQQPQAEEAQKDWQRTESGKSGKEEPSSHMPSDQAAETAVFMKGELAVPGAPADSQTIAARNRITAAMIKRTAPRASLCMTGQRSGRVIAPGPAGRL